MLTNLINCFMYNFNVKNVIFCSPQRAG